MPILIVGLGAPWDSSNCILKGRSPVSFVVFDTYLDRGVRGPLPRRLLTVTTDGGSKRQFWWSFVGDAAVIDRDGTGVNFVYTAK